MKEFVAQYSPKVIGVLEGFDRVRVQASFLRLSNSKRPRLAGRSADGLITILSAVEPCRTWFVRGNKETKKLELKLNWGKCIHLYFYFLHEQLGFLHLRLQTWFPFLVQVCFNGREWLSRQMETAGIKYRRRDNCIPLHDLTRQILFAITTALEINSWTCSKALQRKQTAAVSRKLALLRAHGLIRKVSGRHLYHVSPKGRHVITALLAARQASLEELTKLAA